MYTLLSPPTGYRISPLHTYHLRISGDKLFNYNVLTTTSAAAKHYKECENIVSGKFEIFGHPQVIMGAPQDRNIYVFHLVLSMRDLSALLPSPIYFSCFHQRFTLPALCVYTPPFNIAFVFAVRPQRSFLLSLKYHPSYRIRIFLNVFFKAFRIIRDSPSPFLIHPLDSPPFLSFPLLILFSSNSLVVPCISVLLLARELPLRPRNNLIWKLSGKAGGR